jgi:hypothetical protein
LDLRGDEIALACVEDHVDPFPGRVADRDLRVRVPSRVELGEEGFEDPCLVSITNGRPRVRIDPRTQVGPERNCKLRIGVDGWAFSTILDPAEIREVDAGRLNKL